MKRPRARFAAPIVMTVASLGCASPPPGPTGPNPPGPERQLEPVYEPKPPPEPIHVNPPPPIHVNPPPIRIDLPEASPGASVDRRTDGTCWEMVHVICHPGATCNPPPPHQVRCPPSK